MERVVICLHVGANTVSKVWRFDIDRFTEYTRKSIESELIQLFPDIARKRLRLRMWYLDDLAGEVSNSNALLSAIYLPCYFIATHASLHGVHAGVSSARSVHLSAILYIVTALHAGIYADT